VQRIAKLLNTVVIVPDAPSYLAAIGAWTPTQRFPVLIDDGSFECHDQIARFVRGYGAANVVRWRIGGGDATHPAPDSFNTVTEADIGTAVARSWGLPQEQATLSNLGTLWKFNTFQPLGLVAVNTEDPAWPAGAALASARGQVLVFVKTKRGVDTLMSPADADALSRTLEEAAEASGVPWRQTGDGLEAITLCLNTPNRLDKGGGEFLAVTDRIGRLGTGVTADARWAWCGQIFGSPSRAVYHAMCSLFIQPRGAWLFDGYSESPPWNEYDATKAGSLFTQAKFSVEVMDTPRQGAADWRLRAARPVDAGVILVNSSGNDDFFNLQPGKARPGDVPILLKPAVVHIVHSWSATNAGNRDRLAGRWLERGAFCYAGSVHEPYLQAFLPTPVVAARLLTGAPFGAAVRPDTSPLWKITVIGDPLFTLTQERALVDEPLPLEGGAGIRDGIRASLDAKNFAAAFRDMNLCGMDDASARLAAALLASTPDAIDPGAAEQMVLPLFRAGRTELVWQAFARMDTPRRANPMLRDALWLTTEPLLTGRSDDVLLTTLKGAIRPEQGARDALQLGRAWATRHGRESAMAMLGEVRRGLAAAQQEDLDRRIGESTERWGE